jgi:hypothetical protein
MEEDSSWEANSRTANQEILFFVEPEQSLLWTQKPATDSYRKDKGKVHPRTGHEGTEGSRGIALLFL